MAFDDGFGAAVVKELDAMQAALLEAARARTAAATHEVSPRTCKHHVVLQLSVNAHPLALCQ
jgi:hypothetical protein